MKTVFWYRRAGLGAVLLLLMMLLGTAVLSQTLLRAQEEGDIYLPMVAKPPATPTPTPTPTSTPAPTLTPTPSPTPNQLPLPQIANPSFEEGWTNLPPPPEDPDLINQQPNGWQLSWLSVGQPLYDDPSQTAGGIPECIHKLAWQLPPNEQPGGEDALILDGVATYKMFSASAPFGSELRQTITGLHPGSSWIMIVPMQVHLHGDLDPYAAESGVWVNSVGGWANGGLMGDRDWYEHVVPFTVPANGQVEIVVRVKSKWPTPKDFFIDALRVERP